MLVCRIYQNLMKLYLFISWELGFMMQKQLFEIPSSRTGMFFGDKFPNVPYNFRVGHAEPCSFHQRREGVVWWCGRVRDDVALDIKHWTLEIDRTSKKKLDQLIE